VKKIFLFDLDNTICTTQKNYYKKSFPKKKIIKKINDLKLNGHTIKIFTSRYMGRNLENSKRVKKKYYNITMKQLLNWGLKFDELIMGKPSYDFHIDDKSFNSNSKKAKDLLKKYGRIKK
tara:strand:- start:461 stop:820 length:360 start_codon:yes stop_codon:yes gene_type:complete